MLDANPESIIHFPLIQMSKFNRTLGPIPPELGGGNRYRLIWAPSRRVLRFTCGVSEVVSMYFGKGAVQPLVEKFSTDPEVKPGECWVLEMWQNPFRECTEEQWNSMPVVQVPGVPYPQTRLQVMGPFPRRGYYWKAENTVIAGEPTETQVEKQILMIEDGMLRYRPYENYIAIRDKIEKGEKDVASERDAIIRNRFLIGGGEAYSVAGGSRNGITAGRGTKTINTSRTSRDLAAVGISTKPGATSMMPRRNKKVYDLTKFIR